MKKKLMLLMSVIGLYCPFTFAETVTDIDDQCTDFIAQFYHFDEPQYPYDWASLDRKSYQFTFSDDATSVTFISANPSFKTKYSRLISCKLNPDDYTVDAIYAGNIDDMISLHLGDFKPTCRNPNNDYICGKIRLMSYGDYQIKDYDIMMPLE